MISAMTTRLLIFAAAVMLAAQSSAQTPFVASEQVEKLTEPKTPEADKCSIDLRLPGKMKDIVSNVLIRSAKLPETKVQEFLKDATKHYATGDALMRAAAKHFMIDETQDGR